MRFAVLAAATLCALPVLARLDLHSSGDHIATPDLPQDRIDYLKRDWHIRCATTGKCSYYEDASSDRGGLERRQLVEGFENAYHHGPAPRDDEDANLIHTRCNPANSSLVQRFENGEWVNHYLCPIADSCTYLGGHGACPKGDGRWIVPVRHRVTERECKDPKNLDSCRVVKTQPIGQAPISHERGILPPSRCRPGSNVIQFLDADGWIDFHTCSDGNSCVESSGKGACRKRSTPSLPFSRPDKQRKREDPLATRCKPRTTHIMQYFDAGKWFDYAYCPPPDSCVGTKGTCGSAPPAVFPIPGGDRMLAATRCNPDFPSNIQYWNDTWVGFHNCTGLCTLSADTPVCLNPDGGIETHNYVLHHPDPCEPPSEPTEDPDDQTTDEESMTPAVNRIMAGDIQTRCHPDDRAPGGVVQHYVDGDWVNFYWCQIKCEQIAEMTACRQANGKYVVPVPPSALVRREAPSLPHIGSVSSRCSPESTKEFQVFQDGYMILKGDCPAEKPCREVEGWAECEWNGQQWFPERPGLLLSRQDPTNPSAPDFHTVDTRCNPRNGSEVRRFNGTDWEHHYTCMFVDSCKDVDGHGACRLIDNLYAVPAANQSSVEEGEPNLPLRAQTKCNPQNETEVLQWNGTKWSYYGVCLPPYVCDDFAGAADFVVCTQPGHEETIWLPWPALTAPSTKGHKAGFVTRCRNKENLEWFNGKTWVPYRRCAGGFKCHRLEYAPHNGGCVATSIEEVKRHHQLLPHHAVTSEDDADHYEPFGFDHYSNLLKRTESGLVDDGGKLINQGETLVDLGDNLIDDSKDLRESIDSPASESESDSDVDAKRPSEKGLVEDSKQIRAQGEDLIREGNRIVGQGRKLLHAIYGDDAEVFVASITAPTTSVTTASGPTQTGTVQQARHFPDGLDGFLADRDDECDCDPDDADCLINCVIARDVFHGNTNDECNCGPDDWKCWINCGINDTDVDD